MVIFSALSKSSIPCAAALGRAIGTLGGRSVALIDSSSKEPLIEKSRTIFTGSAVPKSGSLIREAVDPLTLTRSFATVKSTPGERISDHLAKTDQGKRLVLCNSFLKRLPKSNLDDFIKLYGPPNGSLEYTLNAYNALIEAFPPSTELMNSYGKWATYPVKTSDALAGGTHKFSSNVSKAVCTELPRLLTNLYGAEYRPSIIEIGGFGFNDTFLLQRSMEREGIHSEEHIGIDIHHGGKLTAEIFNEDVAQVPDFHIKLQGASSALDELLSTHQEKDKVLIALRFLATLQPQEIAPFFSSIGRLMSPRSVIIINYTLRDSKTDFFESELKKEEGFSLKTELPGIHVLRQGDEHLQTLMDEKTMHELVEKNELRIIGSRSIMPIASSDVRPSIDQHTRVLLALLKK